MASAPIETPLSSSAAPELTLIPPAIAPNAELLDARITPELIVTPPEKSLEAPESVSVPAPSLTKDPEPVIFPVKLVFASLPPTVN